MKLSALALALCLVSAGALLLPDACMMPGPLTTTARLLAPHFTIVLLAVSNSRCGMDMSMSGKP